MHRRATVFEQIYSERVWVNGSGSGSAPENTEPYRSFLQEFLESKRIRTVFDLGCGDWQSSRLINWCGADYVGFDIVRDVVESNRRLYGAEQVRFEYLADEADLPAGDLLIVKDVLQHLPNPDIHRIANLIGRYAYVLVTNTVSAELRRNDGSPVYTQSVNTDLAPGGMRPIDVLAEPFGWEGREVHRYKSFRGGLGAWETKSTVLLARD
ncbi:class I SAM-dependent methyltransferase [Mycobacterium adipatum]|uniref:class I SAM-dependent methyltransferase n=1 Tax=Mycobacterium adipatum TaxID=1682113 RepID=UPI0034E0BAB5